MYCSQNCTDCQGDWNVSTLMQRDLEDLLYFYRVDLAIYGHYHSYQRTCAVYNQSCVEDGIVHIVVGTAGFGIDDSGQFIDTQWNEFYWVKRVGHDSWNSTFFFFFQIFKIFKFGWGYLLISTKENPHEMSVQLISSKDPTQVVDQILIQRKKL